MAKINVTLRCQMDSGKEVKMPGEAVNIEDGEARKLAAMGMVELPAEKPDAKSAKQPKKQGAAIPTDNADPGNDTDDTDGDAEGNGEGV